MNKNQSAFLVLIAAALLAGCNGSEQKATLPAPPSPAAPVKAELPPGHPPIDMSQQTLPAGTVADVGNPKWDVPAGWQPGKVSSMRRASYIVIGAADKAGEIVVTAFPGDVGGPVANVNRWRGQLGLAPLAPDAIADQTTKLTVAGEPATQVDFKNDQTDTQMIVVTVPHAGNSWFYKLTGPTAVVAAQKADFLKFVQSVKY